MKRTNHDRLLDEILGQDEMSDFRQESLNRGLSALRRRRRVRQGLTAATLIALISPLIWFVQPQRAPQSVSNARQMPASSPRQINFISDEQLLSLFPGRSVALIGKPGHQKLLFLDEADAQSRESL